MKKDMFAKKMPVHYSFLRNYLCGILFCKTEHLIHRIIVEDVYGQDHEIFYKIREVNKVPRKRHVYHMRYHVSVPFPILSLRLERYTLNGSDWEVRAGIDFSSDYARHTFKSGWYTLFDSFRWDDVFGTCD